MCAIEYCGCGVKQAEAEPAPMSDEREAIQQEKRKAKKVSDGSYADPTGFQSFSLSPVPASKLSTTWFIHTDCEPFAYVFDK